MKKTWMVLALLLMITLIIQPAFAEKKDPGKDFLKTEKIPSIQGKVKEVRPQSDTLEVNEIKDGRPTSVVKILKIVPLSKIYYKKRPGQLTADQLTGKITDFKKGDVVIATSANVDGNIITVKKIWDTRAFMVYTGQISVEKEYKGKVESIDKTKRVVTLKTLPDKETVEILLDRNAKVYINNQEGNFNEIHPGAMIYARCRWPGFEEDKPAVITAVEVKDDKTYVIHKVREEFGPVIASGKVLAIDMKTHTIKISDASGSTDTINFLKNTKWILGGNLKSPKELVGVRVYAFGKPSKEKKKEALQVINEVSLPSLFEYLIETGGKLGSQRAVLAMGECIFADKSRVAVKTAGGKTIECKIHPQAIFVKKGKKVPPAHITKGDWVKVEGFIAPKGQKSIAILVISFGPTPKNLKKEEK